MTVYSFTCQVCQHSFGAERRGGKDHVYRTWSNTLLVLCHCCMAAARLDELARRVLWPEFPLGKWTTDTTDPSKRVNPWGSE